MLFFHHLSLRGVPPFSAKHASSATWGNVWTSNSACLQYISRNTTAVLPLFHDLTTPIAILASFLSCPVVGEDHQPVILPVIAFPGGLAFFY